ncbi:sigma-70 family RNA polymerase sigma factor [Aeoliella sp.]|uniref:sigma-70 family RNA polymerase sigma factor n=1 Tax=Aeoliella sp. TaxID=2795800 RepID=UPI003CCBA301
MHSRDEHQIAAFSDLLAASRSRVFGYIYAMLHNMSDAEDIYQQTTVLLWEKFGEYQPGTEFTSWALKIAYFNIKNFQRSQHRARVFFSESVMEKVADSFLAESDREADERTEALSGCLNKLSPEQQELLRLRYSDGASVKQLAEQENKTEAAVAMVLTRLRKSLLKCIKMQMAIGR